MDVVFIVLLIAIAILVAAIIFLVIKLGKKMTDEERQTFLSLCLNAVKILIAALADGKITADELKQILKALVEIIACFRGDSYAYTADSVGAAPYIVDNTDEVIAVEK